MYKNIEINITKIPRELMLILEIIKSEENDMSFSDYLHEINWDSFLQLALHHRLYPVLYTKLLKNEKKLVPEWILQSLKQHFRKNTFKMLYLCGEMEQLSKVFTEHKIRSLFLKGPILAADLYGDISQRTCGDLDILIPIEDLDKANQLLEKIGYKKDEYIKSLLNDWKWRHHHFTYYHPIKNTKIEIHWRLNPAPGKEPGFNELWDRKRKTTITGFPSYYLGNEDLFFFLVTHGARHGWSRLRWLLDIHQMVKTELKWETLIELFKKHQSLHIGGQALILSANLMGSHLDKKMKSLINGKLPIKLASESIFYVERMVNLHTDPVPREISEFHAKHLFSLMSFQQKVVYLLSFLHPYYADAETLPLPNRLHFLYYPLRPVLWVFRKTRKHALP
ncbi:putative nucleotidyltransferase-like protein [Cytobacillus firmus]|uniref:Putative nucleotidyltransferase-like protein n=2 Tax=Cytobacillus TaxID=2675230 RepID=A0A366JL48_CYTFI|nr:MULTISPECIES: nucleotidyltransferase family protein [Cytobacillus]RBP88291.1 putative nucleotidyltransferase-like protein [Cytobacillus firmus]TDX38364.1 putative nucleotidyltransferase-like protein [Cytobacillus oceanisediminis]